MKNVMLIRSNEDPATSRILDYARQKGWHVQIVEYTTNSVESFQLDNKCSYPDARRLLGFWHPDGCIVQCGAAPLTYSKSDFNGTPTVFLDRDPETIEPGAPCVCSDSREIAECAARELMRANFDHFACVEFPTDLSWNVMRSRCFQEIIRLNGKTVTAYRLPRKRPYDPAANRLVRFLKTLPRPVGIFTTNDAVGRQVLDACQKLGEEIPGKISIVSVDNLADVCERRYATLTSIELDLAAAGQLAAQMLSDLMDGRKTPLRRSFGVRRIVFRSSAPSVPADDPRFLAGLEYIRLHAADGITVGDVVKSMTCSRRLAYALFKRFSGHTILDTILSRRLESAAEMLSNTDLSVNVIAQTTGFEGDCDFRRVFKRYRGMSPRDWRTQARS